MQKKIQGAGQTVVQIYQQLDAMCGSILSVDRAIKSVAVINGNGRIIEKNSRPVFAHMFSDRPSDFVRYALQASMAEDFGEGDGPSGFHMPERPGITTLTFPAGGSLVLVTAEGSPSPLELARRIGRVIDSYTRPCPRR